MIDLRRVLVLVVVALACARSALAGDPRAFVEIDSGTRSAFVGEPFVVTLRVGLEPTLLQDRLVPLFQRAADVPIRVTARSLASDEDAGRSIMRIVATENVATIAFDDEVVPAERAGRRIVDGQPFDVFELRFRAIVDVVGPCAFDAPTLAFASATRFEDDLFQGRVPLDRVESVVHGSDEVVQIVALPTEDVPESFCGAIGRVTLDVSSPTREVVLGQGLAVTVTIAGDGNLEPVLAPDDSPWQDFHVRGVLERREANAVHFEFDVVPTTVEVTAIPALRVASFDPIEGGRYVEIESRALPLVVLPDADGRTSLVEDDANSEADELSPEAEPDDGAAGGVPGWIVFVVVAMVFALLWRALGRWTPTDALQCVEVGPRRASLARAPEPPAPIDRRAVLARCRSELAQDAERAIVAYLATQLRVPAGAVHAPDLASRLEVRGIDAALARRVSTWLQRCLAARYGGEPAPDAARDADSWLGELDAALASTTTDPARR